MIDKQKVIEALETYKSNFNGSRAALRAQQEQKNKNASVPCDLCAYNPPSSYGGKPCCTCPAEAKNKQKED